VHQKHYAKVLQAEAAGRLAFTVFSVLWRSSLKIELKYLDMKYLFSCIAKPASPGNALAPSEA